jgi:hypothetical protein
LRGSSVYHRHLDAPGHAELLEIGFADVPEVPCVLQGLHGSFLIHVHPPWNDATAQRSPCGSDLSLVAPTNNFEPLGPPTELHWPPIRSPGFPRAVKGSGLPFRIPGAPGFPWALQVPLGCPYAPLHCPRPLFVDSTKAPTRHHDALQGFVWRLRTFTLPLGPRGNVGAFERP